MRKLAIKRVLILRSAALAIVLSGCNVVYDNALDPDNNPGGDADTDTDIDADTDADNDTDSDTDTETDSDGTCHPEYTPITLASGQDSPTSITVDDNFVYWTNWGTRDAQRNHNKDGTVMRIRKDGGEADILASGLTEPTNIAVDDTHLYWINSTRQAGGFGDVLMVDKRGGTSIVLAESIREPEGLALTDTHVYWVGVGPMFKVNSTKQIYRIQKDDQSRETIVAETSGADELFFTGGSVYWIDTQGYLSKAPGDGSGQPEQIARLTGEYCWPYYIELGSGGIFVLHGTPTGHFILKKALLADPGDVTNLYFSPTNRTVSADGMVITQDDIYWLLWDEGSKIIRTPPNSGPSEEIVCGQHNASGIALDGQYIYWTNHGEFNVMDGTVMRVPLIQD